MRHVNRLYFFLWYLFWPFYNLVHPSRLKGREKLPKDGALFCANHSSLSDPVCVGLVLGPRYQVRAMAKAEFMNLPFLGWLFKKAGFFAVDRGKNDVGAMKQAIRYLKAGENVLLFPEGTRIHNGVDKNGQPGRAKSGAMFMAVRTGVPIVPLYVPVKKPWFRFTTVVVGDPYYPKVESKHPSSEEYQALADDMLKRIYALEEPG